MNPSDSRNAIHNLITARSIRDFGDSFVAVLLPVYLIQLGFSPFQVGLLATVALFGSACITLTIGIFGGRHDHRRLLRRADRSVSSRRWSIRS
jgi:MFS family permease